MTHHTSDQNPDPRHACPATPQRIHGRAELITAIPYLLGFHPSVSLVLVGLDDDSRLIVTARLDLAAPSIDNAAPSGGPDMPIAEALSAMAHGGSTQVIAVAYPDSTTPAPPTGSHSALPATREQPDRAEPVGASGLPPAELMTAHVREVGLELVDYLLVDLGGWRSLTSQDTNSCPPGGTPLPSAPSVFQIQATVSGWAPAVDRSHLHHRFSPTGDHAAVATALAELTTDKTPCPAAAEDNPDSSTRVCDAGAVQRLMTTCRAAGDRYEAGAECSDATTATDSDVAFFGVSLRRISVRDAIWLAVDDVRLPDPTFWLQLSRRLPAPYSAGPLFLYGWHAWRQGNGALARIAADRALAADPAYSAARLLLTALDAGINPLTMPILTRPA